MGEQIICPECNGSTMNHWPSCSRAKRAMTPQERARQCKSWIVVDGMEYKCQWNEGHMGCHSGRNDFDGKKIKWDYTTALQDAERMGRDAGLAEIVPMIDEIIITHFRGVVSDPEGLTKQLRAFIAQAIEARRKK